MLPKKIIVPLVVAIIIIVIISVIALSGDQEPEDNTPPGKVSGLSASDLRDGRILLVWNAAHDDVEVAFYSIFRDMNKLEKRPSVPMTVDNPGDVRVPHEYRVQAVDGSGNEAEISDPVSISSLPSDLIAPSEVTGLTVHTYYNQLNLTWEEAWDNDRISGYHVHRDGSVLDFQSSRPLYYDLNVTPMLTHSYRVSAVDASGNMGPPSAKAEGYLPPGRVGQMALDFNLTDVYDRDFSLYDFRGKVVLLDLMTTTCSHCQPQEGELVKLFGNYSSDDLQMISIDISPDADPQDLIIFKESFADDWFFAVDTDNVSEKYSTRGVPTAMVIDKSGKIAYVHVGLVSAEELEDIIDPLITT
jgi:peroxiredoxin